MHFLHLSNNLLEQKSVLTVRQFQMQGSFGWTSSLLSVSTAVSATVGCSKHSRSCTRRETNSELFPLGAEQRHMVLTPHPFERSEGR
jgi:hypothetical protein